jgi:chemotaxis protein methyltransferase CheR
MGCYSDFEMARGMSDELRQLYFRPLGDRWQVDAALRRRITWRRINVVEPFPSLPPMDLVFFRNVMIYFDTDMRRRALLGVRAVLRPGGFLFVGAAENLMAHSDLFESVQIGRTLAYRPAGGDGGTRPPSE